MPPMLEQMAQQLVRSGKLRINADEYANFVKYSTPANDRSFSARELTDPTLLPATRATIAQSVPMGLGQEGIEEVVEQLQRDLKRARGIEAEKELRVARVLMQSAHPAVMLLALQEGAEFFVSYSHNVGDLMAMHFWNSHGLASGLQSACDNGTAIYVSCSGDPFFEGDQKTYTTDGWPALARMVVIAGQEIGHYADLLRDAQGVYGRVSARMAPLSPSPECKAARDSDRLRLQQLAGAYQRRGMGALLKAEQAVAFYDARRKFSLPWLFCQGWRMLMWCRFLLQAGRGALKLTTYPAMRRASAIAHFMADMAFNLAPDADVYRRANPVEEEAIACIEALARVPQQVNKWGHAAVLFAIPNMYALYYGGVIPHVTGALAPEMRHLARTAGNIDAIQSVRSFLSGKLRKKPGWHPDNP